MPKRSASPSDSGADDAYKACASAPKKRARLAHYVSRVIRDEQTRRKLSETRMEPAYRKKRRLSVILPQVGSRANITPHRTPSCNSSARKSRRGEGDSAGRRQTPTPTGGLKHCSGGSAREGGGAKARESPRGGGTSAVRGPTDSQRISSSGSRKSGSGSSNLLGGDGGPSALLPSVKKRSTTKGTTFVPKGKKNEDALGSSHMPCSFCGSDQILQSPSSGDVTCHGCGLVQRERLVDVNPAWRPNEIGPIGEAPPKELGAAKREIPPQKLAQAKGEIQNACDQLDLGDAFSQRAADLYMQFAETQKAVREREVLVGACVYLACEMQHHPRTYKEVLVAPQFAQVTQKMLGSKIVKVKKTLGLQFKPPMAHELCVRWCGSLDLPPRVDKAAEVGVAPGIQPCVRACASFDNVE